MQELHLVTKVQRRIGLSEPSADRIKLLTLVDIFEPLSEEEIEHLAGRLPGRHLENGEIFYGPEDSSERLFILQRGKVRIFRTTPDGREFTLAWLNPAPSSGRWRSQASSRREPTPRRCNLP